MGAADHNLRAAGCLLHFDQKDLERLVLAVSLAANLVVRAHDATGAVLTLGLVGIEVNEYGGALFDALHAAADDLALVSGILFEDLFPLRLAQALHEHLAGGLGGDAAGVVGDLLVLGNLAADFGGGQYSQGVREGDLRLRVIDFLDDAAQGKDADITGIRVQLDSEILSACHAVATESGGKRDFHLVEDQLLAQAPLGG